MKKILGFAFLAAFTMLFTAGIDTAEARGKKKPESKLKGTYARTRTRTCIRTNGVFDSNNRIAPAFPGQNPYGHTRTNVITGSTTFNGDGTGSLEFDGLSIRNITSAANGGTSPQFSFTGPGTCDFTYTLDGNSFELITSSCSTANSTSTGMVIQGQIARGGQLLTISDTDTNVETITTNSGSVIRRICNRSGVAVKVRKKK